MPLFWAYLSVLLALSSGAIAALAEFGPGRAKPRRSTAASPTEATPAPHPRHGVSWSQRCVFGALALSGLAAIWGGALALLAPEIAADQLPLGLPWMHWQVRLDALSGFFLAVIGIGVIAASLFGPGYVLEYRESRHPLWLLGLGTGLFVAGMELVLLANDAFFFVVAWELMSVSSYFLVAFQHEHPANRRAAFLYLLMAVIGAIAIILAFGVLAAFSHGFGFDGFRETHLTGFWGTTAFLLALLGFGMKAGLAPGHAWLPEAHPVAPSHISALMSGVMLKVAVYGLIRFAFDLLGDVQWQWGVLVLASGTASAVLGVLYAFQQTHIKRLLAYSSIENMGIIAMGIGLSMIFLGTGHAELGAIGLVAALMHALNHSLFKNLLFLTAGSILHQTHEADLDHLGGLIRRMPVTALLALLGCIAISALPPLNGFVSEWLTFQAALRASALDSGVLRSMIPVAAAALAFTGAIAAATFVKFFGIAFLGLPRRHHAAHAHEVRHAGMLAGPALLALLCLVLGVMPTLVIHFLDPVTRMLLGATFPGAAAEGWLWLTPGTPAEAAYSAPFVAVALGVAGLVAHGLARGASRTGELRGAAWDCGFGGLNARMQYTAVAFSQPIRRMFAPVWELREKFQGRRDAGTLEIHPMAYHLEVADRSWRVVYAPLGRLVEHAARQVARLQTGSIRTYITYSFLTLLLLLGIISG